MLVAALHRIVLGLDQIQAYPQVHPQSKMASELCQNLTEVQAAANVGRVFGCSGAKESEVWLPV